jgi:hypothetical protein
MSPDTRVVGSFLKSSVTQYRKVQVCDMSSIAAVDLLAVVNTSVNFIVFGTDNFKCSEMFTLF